MPVLTQQQIAEQMVAQVRLLKPSISAEVGTPERLVFDTVANAISENSIDLIGLQNALNVDSKFGSNLTNFMALFGFDRLQASTATGFVKFTRTSPANVDIVIPAGVILKSHVATTTDGLLQEFVTTASVTLPAGETETPLCPVRARNAGSPGNVPAEAITILVFQASILGITGVTNPAATTGGSDQEDDNSFKVRFKNTVFRNLAGTQDQFLALAVATAFSTKAVAIGPISKYQEYVQVPKGDDTTTYPFGGGTPYSGVPYPAMVRCNGEVATITIESTIGVKAGEPALVYEGGSNPALIFSGTIKEVLNGTELVLSKGMSEPKVDDGWLFVGDKTSAEELLVDRWTTGLSSNPFAKEIWGALPVFVSNITSGISKFFFREGVDFNFSFPPALQGDTLRAMIDSTSPDPRSDPTGRTQPNLTFINVYLGAQEAIKAVAPEDIVLIEYAYTSTSSRNSILHNVTNAVDVYVDGGNEQATSTIFTAPLATSTQAFVDDPISMYYYENYRRDGEPTKRPMEGNILTPLFSQPILNLPQQITIGESKYYLGTHYWLVHDVSLHEGTIRARDGIEWSATIKGDRGGPEEGIPTPAKPEPEYGGFRFSEIHSPTTLEVEPYFYDQNIEDLQAALEANRQITTDVLAHKAHLRFFKLDITVVYSPQATPATVNANIREALATFFANQYFGSVIRLSDLLQQIHNVAGVQNVRWSNDVPNDNNLVRVFETDNNGIPLRGVTGDRFRWGSTGDTAIQTLYITGNPTEGTFRLRYGAVEGELETTALPIATVTAAELEAALRIAHPEAPELTVTEDSRSLVGVASPIRSFRIAYGEEVAGIPIPRAIYSTETPVEGGEYVYDSDFFLRDDELPTLPTGLQEGDTVPGLIIRPRAENVWQKA
jgi:uncharacterized phage protein gp47/JayE